MRAWRNHLFLLFTIAAALGLVFSGFWLLAQLGEPSSLWLLRLGGLM